MTSFMRIYLFLVKLMICGKSYSWYSSAQLCIGDDNRYLIVDL